MIQPTYVIIGYTLESVLWARQIALSGSKIVYIKSGKLGHPYDEVNEYLSLGDINLIKSLKVDFPVKKLHNGTYIHIPYDQLKFVNNRNGLISFPLNKSSFESAEEWEQIEICIKKLDKFRENLSNASNFVNIYKNFFPKWLYDCLLKHVGINKWGSFRQSKFTREALDKEINLSQLKNFGTGDVYRPKISYEKLCNSLLKNKNIEVKEITIEELRDFIVARHKNTEIALTDNRVDYICKYAHGNFDRVEFKCEKIKDPNMEEFIDIGEGIVFTPTKDYFCALKEEGIITKITSKKIDTLNYCEQSCLSPTAYNRKLYNEYKKLINLYSRKKLNFDPIFHTTVI